MSKITNNSIEYHTEVKRKLKDEFDINWKPLWNYTEMTQTLNYGYSFTFLVKDGLSNRRLLYRNWRNELNKKDRIGIYNLNAIIIEEEVIDISLNDLFEIQEMIKRDIKVTKFEGIILDGYFKQFTDHKLKKELVWNIDDEMNKCLSDLIFRIRKLKST